jgi:hypothetical protein
MVTFWAGDNRASQTLDRLVSDTAILAVSGIALSNGSNIL